ncbi:MAG: glycosyltransferase family 39 protein [Gemmatimonadota bacterium]
MATDPGAGPVRRFAGPRPWLTLLALTALAGAPRLANLGELSFYSDEETTAFPARSLAEGEGARMPTGMEYRRALPLTWLNAASASVLGEDRELSYRLPTAVIGTLTVPLLFLVGRALVGGPAGAVAASMLALSEWHLAISRQARMYAALSFFFLLAAWATWRWARRGGTFPFLCAAAAFAAALSMHSLAFLGAVLPLVPLALPGWSKVKTWKLVAFAAGAATVGLLYGQYFVDAPYGRWAEVQGTIATAGTGRKFLRLGPLDFTTGLTLVLAASSLAIGTYVWIRSRAEGRDAGRWLRNLAVLALAVVGAFLALAGQVYGALVATFLLLMLRPQPRSRLWRQLRPVAVPLAVAALAWISASIGRFGVSGGLKAVMAFPFPYPVYLARQSPGGMFLFVAVCAWLALRRPRPGEEGVRACALTAVLLMTAIGVASRWGPTRFLSPAEPFLLLVAGWGLARGLAAGVERWAKGRRLSIAPTWIAAGLGLALVASGLLGGEGVRQVIRGATLRPGEPVNELIYTYPFRPDHRGPGRYVRDRLRADDVVIAEDPLEQRWYAGRADFWFRAFNDARRYLYPAADGGLRDIYVDSRLLRGAAELDSLIAAVRGRAWLITSGETLPRRDRYLDEWQRRWLDSLEAVAAPVFQGLDGVSRVYCLNCPAGSSAAAGSLPPQPLGQAARPVELPIGPQGRAGRPGPGHRPSADPEQVRPRRGGRHELELPTVGLQRRGQTPDLGAPQPGEQHVGGPGTPKSFGVGAVDEKRTQRNAA